MGFDGVTMHLHGVDEEVGGKGHCEARYVAWKHSVVKQSTVGRRREGQRRHEKGAAMSMR